MRLRASIDGISILPLLRERGKPKRDTIHWHFPHYPCSAAIRSGDHKLIEFFGERLELYTLTEDIAETTDLAETMPENSAALHEQLHAWLKEAGAWMPIPNPAYDPSVKEPDLPPMIRHASFMLNRRVSMEELQAVMRKMSNSPPR